MLTRKHMNALAEVVKNLPDDARLPVLYTNHYPNGAKTETANSEAWVDLSDGKASLAGQLANICANSNGAFDYRRFFEACGVDAEKAWSYA